MLALELRNELYRLFVSSLRLSKREGFQWLEFFVERCREKKLAAFSLTDLSSVGRSERHLDQRGLMDLLGSCGVLRLVGAEIELGAFDGHPLAYLEDRLPRYHETLRELFAAPMDKEALKRDVRVAAVLFNNGLFFDCHEYLEGPWKAAAGDLKIALQGLIQAGAGLHKYELGSKEGCAELLGHAVEKLERSGELLPCKAKEFAADLALAKASLSSGRFNLGQAPKLAVTP